MSLCCFVPIAEDEMRSPCTLVCVKRVKDGMPEDDWDENMPLPGDIIEGVAGEEGEGEDCFLPTKVRSDLSTQLGRLSKNVSVIWVKVRRGDGTLKLQARVVQERTMPRRFTIQAMSDERHVAVLEDLTQEQCTELQEMSRRVVNMVVDHGGFQKKEMKYDWKKKVGNHLPDPQSSVICSILFMPLPSEAAIEATTGRSMAWFSAAISSGVPLIFVNIQTEQILSSERQERRGSPPESRCKQQHSSNAPVEIVHGIRLWFLPGDSEVPVFLSPHPGETRFGMDIKRTEEGFIFIYGAAKGLAADRAGVRQMREQAAAAGFLLVIARLDGKSLMPTTVSSTSLIHCCDHNDVKATLSAAIESLEGVQLHIMRFPTTQNPSPPNQAFPITALTPPQLSFSIDAHFTCNPSNRLRHDHSDLVHQ